MTNWKWNEFNKLESYFDLEEYFNNRDLTHTNYCHYTSLKSIDSILKTNRIRLGCVNFFNDKKEVDDIINAENKFAVCFSSGVNENLPLWYLYSGISGKGARLRITKSTFKKMLVESKLFLCSLKNGEKINEIPLNKERLEHRDILYCSMKNGKTSVKYNTMTNYSIPVEELEKYKTKHNGFTKSVIWFYEKETRLLYELKEEEQELKKRLILGDGYCVEMDISNIRKNIHIDLAPEVLIDEVVNNENFVFINKFLYSTSKVQSSEYVGQVKMDLFKQNLSFIEGECLNSVDSDDERKVINGVFDKMRKK